MKPTVCIIDDDVSVQRALRRLVQASGYQVMTCSSATEFLALTDLPHPICLVVDVRLPGMTGLDLQAALPAIGRDIPVVMISGHADTATILRALSAGAVSFLCKPFESETLLEALEQALRKDRRPVPVTKPLPLQTKG
jgi:FixJ family two-component response regulator